MPKSLMDRLNGPAVCNAAAAILRQPGQQIVSEKVAEPLAALFTATALHPTFTTIELHAAVAVVEAATTAAPVRIPVEGPGVDA